MSSKNLSDNLVALGSGATQYAYDKPDAALLEAFPSPAPPQRPITVTITAPEFTSLCPKTGQPDFATIVVRYQPRKSCVESKSFKLYLGSFRNHGEFHEACVERIGSDLVTLLDPHYLSVEGQFTPRGGIAFWPRFEYHRPYSADGVNIVDVPTALEG